MQYACLCQSMVTHAHNIPVATVKTILVPRAYDLLVSGWIVGPGNSRYRILVPRAYDLLVSGWIVGPGNSRYRMSWISRHPVAHAQCDKLLLRLLSIRKPETFCRRIVNTTIRTEVKECFHDQFKKDFNYLTRRCSENKQPTSSINVFQVFF